MIEIAIQIREDYSLRPFSEEDLDLLKRYKPNQVCKAKISGVTKQRSYRQLKAYWSACKKVADNNESPGWQTKEAVDFQIRVALRFYNPDLIIAKPDGSIAFSYRSIAFKNLRHIEACSFFDRAFEIMANKIDTTVEKLIKSLSDS
jgi:hypothetical protein